jgi:hypothetical protein
MLDLLEMKGYFGAVFIGEKREISKAYDYKLTPQPDWGLH